MRLPPEQVERFYAVWKPLILFVNRRLRVEPALPEDESAAWDPQMVYAVREALWANDPVREAFVAENPAGLSAADLALVASWRHRVAGTFFVFRHLKKHSILIGGDPQQVCAVLGLANSLEEVVPFTPCYAQTVLLPFEGSIIYDSLIVPYNVFLGAGIRRNLDHDYKDAKERGAIVTSLVPQAGSPSRAAGKGEADEVNARVLEAFRKHLYRSGHSPKVVARDVAAVAAFAKHGLATGPEPRWLRDFGTSALSEHLAHLRSAELKESQRKENLTGLARFVRFLRDTERMDYEEAGDALALLRGRGRV
jgi:hypothetical protein